ncbi:uncharacterized protein LOC128573357 isoform X2 [Nycticebus coucang]|uniref:uncharacterized protein LOC128573357 isoform X2 n=1 Tax=Nycticebus coucang TaxID=9470 RepID=UPI00234D7AC5|nr:uncharacterized protein LOC128573357 isoform X2 [Nycticebus coucang]
MRSRSGSVPLSPRPTSVRLSQPLVQPALLLRCAGRAASAADLGLPRGADTPPCPPGALCERMNHKRSLKGSGAHPGTGEACACPDPRRLHPLRERRLARAESPPAAGKGRQLPTSPGLCHSPGKTLSSSALHPGPMSAEGLFLQTKKRTWPQALLPRSARFSVAGECCVPLCAGWAAVGHPEAPSAPGLRPSGRRGVQGSHGSYAVEETLPDSPRSSVKLSPRAGALGAEAQPEGTCEPCGRLCREPCYSGPACSEFTRSPGSAGLQREVTGSTPSLSPGTRPGVLKGS